MGQLTSIKSVRESLKLHSYVDLFTPQITPPVNKYFPQRAKYHVHENKNKSENNSGTSLNQTKLCLVSK